MTDPQNPGSASEPTPQQLNKITTQLRDLNSAYKAAIAANSKAQGGTTSSSKPSK